MGRTWTVLVLAAIALLSVLPPATAESLVDLADEHVGGPRLNGAASPAQVRELDEAAALFADAGLRLPPVIVRFHEDTDSCKGHDGLFTSRAEPWTIDVCSELAYVLVHELAHAWIRANVPAETRSGYLELRGLDAWNDPTMPWMQRGTEDAAFVMQQVLQNRPEQLTTNWQERIAAFELLVA